VAAAAAEVAAVAAAVEDVAGNGTNSE